LAEKTRPASDEPVHILHAAYGLRADMAILHPIIVALEVGDNL
jgi:hypothetical protein